MDKLLTATMLEQGELRIPTTARFTGQKIPIPAVLKLRFGGSSLGVAVVRAPRDIAHFMREWQHYGDILAQQYVQGQEFTCSVLEEHGIPKALPVIQIIPRTTFFD